MRPLPCLHMPDKGDPYFNTKASGGYSPCILGNPAGRVEGLNVLPNCVGYVVGAFNALGDYGFCKWLGNTNAANFVRLAKSQGLEVTEEPTPGGVMVWSGGNGGYGHVAFVEGKATNSDAFVCSESEYYGKAWTLYTRRRGKDGQWRDGCYWMSKSYRYEGCIKNPAIKEVDPVTYEQFCEYMSRWLDELAKKPVDTWAIPLVVDAIESGIMTGDDAEKPFDTFRPCSFVRREELAGALLSVEKSICDKECDKN